MLAATSPTNSLSMPLTTMRVGDGTSKVIPAGACTGTEWLNPRASSILSGPRAAEPRLAGVAVGHEAAAGRHHGDAQAAQHPREVVGLGVHPEPGLGHPLDARDGSGAVSGVLHLDLEGLARPLGVVGHREARDV